MFICDISSHAFSSPLSMLLSVIVSNTRKYSYTFLLIRGLHSWLLPVTVFLKIYFVFIYKRYFHRALNSKSEFQRLKSIVCWPLLFLLRSLCLKGICLYSHLFYFNFLAAFIIFLCLCFGSFAMIFLFLLFFFSPFWLAFSYFLLACLIIFTLEPRNYVWSTAWQFKTLIVFLYKSVVSRVN